MAVGLKERATVVGYVPKRLKERMERIRARDPEWSESKLIRRGLERILPEVESSLFGNPNQDEPDHGRQLVGA